jgi:hypothetical protein
MKNFTQLAQQLSLEATYKFSQSTKLFCYILQEKYLNKTWIFFDFLLHSIHHEPISLLLSLYKFTWLQVSLTDGTQIKAEKWAGI